MQTSRVLINNKSVSITSRIANIMNESFCDWCESIFDTIANEINNQFVLKFISNPVECAVIKYYGSRHPDCLEVQTEDPSIIMPIALRYQSLIQSLPLELDKLIVPADRNVCINYSASISEDTVNGMIEGYGILLSQLPDKLAFQFIKGMNVNSCDDLNPDSINIILTASEEEFDFYMKALSDSHLETYVILNDNSELELIDVSGKMFGFKCDLNSFDLVYCLAEYSILSYCLKKTIDNIIDRPVNSETSKKQLGIAYKAGMISPIVTSITLPDIIETERSATAKISYYPSNAKPPELEYRLSREGYLKCTGNTFYGINDGELDIEVYEKGSIKHIFRKKIRVLHVIRVNSLKFENSYSTVGEGDRLTFAYRYLPEDAENTHRIKWTSTNPCIATVDSYGTITAVSRGTCDIIADIEGVSSKCVLTVKPYVSKIELSHSNIILDFNQVQNIRLTTYPSDCFDERDIAVRYNPPGIAEYLPSYGSIRPKGRGTTQIEFYMPKNPRVRAVCQVTVNSVYDEHKGNLFIILAALSFILSLFLFSLPIYGVSAGVCSLIFSLVSFAKDKGSWQGLNVLLLIVDIISLIIQFNL